MDILSNKFCNKKILSKKYLYFLFLMQKSNLRNHDANEYSGKKLNFLLLTHLGILMAG
jgi:hypothetical protein